VIDVNKGVRPQPLLQFFSRDHFARSFQQDGQNLKWLPSESQLHAALAQFPRSKVNFEGSEPD